MCVGGVESSAKVRNPACGREASTAPAAFRGGTDGAQALHARGAVLLVPFTSCGETWLEIGGQTACAPAPPLRAFVGCILCGAGWARGRRGGAWHAQRRRPCGGATRSSAPGPAGRCLGVGVCASLRRRSRRPSSAGGATAGARLSPAHVFVCVAAPVGRLQPVSGGW